MTFELSLQIKILALVGFVLAAGLVGTLVLAHDHASSNPVVTPVLTTPAHTRAPAHHRAPVAKHATPTVQLMAGLPTPLRSALGHSPLVVAVLYAPGDAVDAEVLAAARQGAASEHAPIVALNIHTDSVAAATATWMNKVVEPAVLVVRQPGTIVVELDGYTDGASVAQAVADSRR
jgi:hypothetical protein